MAGEQGKDGDQDVVAAGHVGEVRLACPLHAQLSLHKIPPGCTRHDSPLPSQGAPCGQPLPGAVAPAASMAAPFAFCRVGAGGETGWLTRIRLGLGMGHV